MNIINTFTQIPIITTLQHCLDAFMVLMPVAVVAFATISIRAK